MKVKGYREIDGVSTLTDIFTIKECTYSGKDMGERSVTATIKWPTVIDFRINDYIEIELSDLTRVRGFANGGTYTEKFYMYTMPTIKKVSSAMSVGDAFEHTVTFYPAQYELGVTMMRDLVQTNSTGIIYTGYDEFSFVGGAKALLDRIIAVLDERFGVNTWSYDISDAINEELNTALETFQFDFSQNTVWDALTKLNDENGINTSFYINDRTIYVGYKCPYVCNITENNVITSAPYKFKYGKTSHLPKNNGEGGLFNITKAIGQKSPITRLYVYGSDRNLNRFYCSDRLASGRYVNKLMLPSFDADGKTDYIESVDGISKYGIREGKKVFDDIYPSLKNITYNNLFQIKYTFKIELCGKTNGNSNYGPLHRIQCYKIEDDGSNRGLNKLTPSYPDKPICICVHATGKICKVILETSENKQRLLDYNHLPVDDSNNVIPGSCFCIHQGTDSEVERFRNYANKEYNSERRDWFINTDINTNNDAESNQIKYQEDARITDIYIYDSENPYDEQTSFSRDGYSAYCWPRINEAYQGGNNSALPVNEVIAVSKIKKEDYDYNDETSEKYFDIFLRDVGFKINEQIVEGVMAHLVGQTFNVQFLDGYLAGINFECSETGITGSGIHEGVSCLYREDGTENPEYYQGAVDQDVAEEARAKGAIWRITLKRNDENYQDYNTILPNTIINAEAGNRIVFLNIYMPDVYIHAAENKMLKDAWKHLNDNDNGDLSYTTEFDKIRLMQVPSIGIQMREGAMMRIYDEDLRIQTDKREQYLYNNDNSIVYRTPFIEYIQTGEKKKIYGTARTTPTNVRSINDKEWWFTFTIPSSVPSGYELPANEDGPFTINLKYKLKSIGYKYETVIPKGTYQKTGNEISFLTVKKPVVELASYDDLESIEYEVVINYFTRSETEYATEQVYAPIGREIISQAEPLLEFSAGKYYTIDFEVSPDTYNKLCLTASLDKSSANVYYPITIKEDIYENYTINGLERRVILFNLPESFDDSKSYYIASSNTSPGTEDYAAIKINSVLESTTDDDSEMLEYQDLTIDQLVIKFTDNGREYSIGGTSNSASGGASSNNTVRSDDASITATVRQKQRASAWDIVSNQTEKNTIASEQTKTTIEQSTQLARKRYRSLESLRNSIFDPDGSIKDVFLQTMMLQVGADSMNYALENVRVFNGNVNGISLIDSHDDTWSVVFANDVLHHYVYTDGDNMGNWNISQKSFIISAEDTYYIAIKCNKNNNTAEWICSTTQHKSDENGFYYFNYGIILPSEADDDRAIIETRGNAYMYGDNVIAGQISTIDGLSYFDLTKNKFALGDKMTFDGSTLKIGKLTSISDGFVNTGKLIIKNEQGQEVSGICGETGDNIAFWAGGNHAAALMNQTPVLITKNGIGSNIGVLKIKNDKICVSTAVGEVRIDDNEGISIYNSDNIQKVLLSPKSLPSITDLQNWSSDVGIQNDATISDYKDSNGDDRITLSTSETFSLQSSKTIRIRYGGCKTSALLKNSNNIGVDYVFTSYIYIKNSNNEIVYTFSADNDYDSGQNNAITLQSGNYTITTVVMFDYMYNGRVTASVQTPRIIFNYLNGAYQTLIGEDGLYSYFSDASHVYYKKGYGFTVKIGNSSFSILDDGSIIMKGLSKTVPSTSGQLYLDSSNNLKVKS